MPVYSVTCSSSVNSRPETRLAPVPAHDRSHAIDSAQSLSSLGGFLPGLAAPEGAVCALKPTGASSRAAREFATTTLRSWGLADLVDDAVVIISELVTNAIRHGLPPYAAAAGEPPIKLTLVRQGGFVVCIVSDPSDQCPKVRAADDICENGRGLHVIEALSRVWGWTPLPGIGKAVWAALTIR